MFERPGRPADRFPSPFPNENAAAAANGGKAPPDLSLMAKARTYERGFPWFITDVFRQYSENGADYLTALLNGYEEPPQGFTVPTGGHYNHYYPGHVIAMPKPLSDGQVEYPKNEAGQPQVPETVEQYARDVTALPHVGGGAASRGPQAPRLPGHAVPDRARGPALLHQEEDLGPGGRRGRRPRHASDDPQSLSRSRPRFGAFFFWRDNQGSVFVPVTMLQTIADEIWGRPCLAYHVQPSLEPEARDAFEAVQRAFAALWPEPLHVGPKHGLHVTIYPLLTVWGDYDKDAYWQQHRRTNPRHPR